jgi:hypothetical protein
MSGTITRDVIQDKDFFFDFYKSLSWIVSVSVIICLVYLFTRGYPQIYNSLRVVLSFCGCLRRSALVALSAAADASSSASARAAATLTSGTSTTSKPAAEADDSGPISTFIGFSSQLVGLGQEKSILTISQESPKGNNKVKKSLVIKSYLKTQK